MRFQEGDIVRIRKDHPKTNEWDLKDEKGEVVSVNRNKVYVDFPSIVDKYNSGNVFYYEDSLRLYKRN